MRPAYLPLEMLESRTLLAADLVPVVLASTNLLIENRGDSASLSYDVRLIGSVNQTIGDLDDREVRRLRALPGIAAGDDYWVGVGNPTQGLPEGRYWIAAIVDPEDDIAESDESNNTYVRTERVTVGSPHADVVITGPGGVIAPGDTTPARADRTEFGSYHRRTITIEHAFTIANQGTDVLEIRSARMGGRSARSFVMTSAPPAALAPGEQATVRVAFEPLGGGNRTARVIIESNDPDTPRYEFAVHGQGVRPAVPSLRRTDGTVIVENRGGRAFEIVEARATPFEYVEFPTFQVRRVPLHRTDPTSWTRIVTAGQVIRISFGGYGLATAVLTVRLGANHIEPYTINLQP